MHRAASAPSYEPGTLVPEIWDTQGDARPGGIPAIPFSLNDYLQLVDWAGRSVRADKRGLIDEKLPTIAQRLNIDVVAWKCAMQPRDNVFGRAMGKLDRMRLHASTLGQSWIRGLRNAREVVTEPDRGHRIR